MQGRLTELTSRLEGLEIDMKKFTATIQQVMTWGQFVVDHIQVKVLPAENSYSKTDQNLSVL